MHRVFISYHHANDQWAKNRLDEVNIIGGIFEDVSVNSGDIDDTYMTDEQIRVKVRDDYLKDSSVTIVLIGTETRLRKHVDWELYSSMRDSPKNKKSGIILVPLPSANITSFKAAHGDYEKSTVFPDSTSWASWSRQEHEARFPAFSKRMIDNLVAPQAKISVVPWNLLESEPSKLSISIELAYRDRATCEYDFTEPMRRRNG